jgi:hypothetical protein
MPVKQITLPAHADGRTVVTFMQDAGDDTFTAMYAAEKWCEDKGISVGESCGPGYPRGLLFGDFLIAKFRNLTAKERAALHGKMTGDMRAGPITIDLKRSPA